MKPRSPKPNTAPSIAPEVENYYTQLPPEQSAILLRIRRHIRKRLPLADEVISYGMPTFRINKSVVALAAFKHHLSLFPCSATVIDQLQAKLDGFEVSKGTIRFTPDSPVPDKLIDELLRCRLTELGLSPPNW